MNAPCYNCERRHIYCHKKCPQYNAYKIKIAEIKSATENDRQNEKSLLDYEQDRYHKFVTRKHRR